MQEENQEDYIVKPDLIAAHLGRLQREHLLVKISIAETANSFNSMLVKIDAENRTMLLDVLHPSSAHQQIIDKKDFNFYVEQHGIKISFKGSVKKVVEDDEKPAYLIDFPDKLLYQQRREAFRAPISKDTLLTITLTSADKKKTYKGMIDNVSRGGLCLRFDHAEKCDFEEFSHLSSQFVTTENIEMTCDVEIRNVTPDSVHRHTIIGVKFKKLDKQQKRHIQNFALRMERKMIKRKRA